jgi:hypothetical protein
MSLRHQQDEASAASRKQPADRESGLSARTIARRLSSVSGPVCVPVGTEQHEVAEQQAGRGSRSHRKAHI